MEKLECIMQCEPDAFMKHLDGSTYLPARQVNDGTKKWYQCEKCGGIFCLDKMTKHWQFSAETYTDLINKGLIKDYLE